MDTTIAGIEHAKEVYESTGRLVDGYAFNALGNIVPEYWLDLEWNKVDRRDVESDFVVDENWAMILFYRPPYLMQSKTWRGYWK